MTVTKCVKCCQLWMTTEYNRTKHAAIKKACIYSIHNKALQTIKSYFYSACKKVVESQQICLDKSDPGNCDQVVECESDQTMSSKVNCPINALTLFQNQIQKQKIKKILLHFQCDRHQCVSTINLSNAVSYCCGEVSANMLNCNFPIFLFHQNCFFPSLVLKSCFDTIC